MKQARNAKESPARWNKHWKRVRIATGCGLWLALILLCVLYRDRLTPEAITAHSPKNLWLAAGLLLLCFSLKSLSVVLYSGILYTASGMILPLPAAIALNLAGTAVMVTLPYLVGRAVGPGALAYVQERHPRIDMLSPLRGRGDFLLSFLSRAVSVFPSDVLSFCFGAMQMPYSAYLAGCLLGMLPQTVTFPVMGTHVRTPGSPEFKAALAVQLIYTAAPLAIYLFLKRKHLNTEKGAYDDQSKRLATNRKQKSPRTLRLRCIRQ